MAADRGPGRDSERRACPNNALPDGPICPKCGRPRAPSGVDGGSWVHFPAMDEGTSPATVTRPALPTPEEVAREIVSEMIGPSFRGEVRRVAAIIAARDAAHAADRARAVDAALARVEEECRKRQGNEEPAGFRTREGGVRRAEAEEIAEYIAALRKELAR